MTFEHVPRQRSSRSVKQQVFGLSALAVRWPVQHGLELCISVTLGSVRGLKYGDWRLYHHKFTWKYEEYFFNKQRHQTKKNQLLGPALTNRFLCFNHLYVQQFPYNRALPAGRLHCYKLYTQTQTDTHTDNPRFPDPDDHNTFSHFDLDGWGIFNL